MKQVKYAQISSTITKCKWDLMRSNSIRMGAVQYNRYRSPVFRNIQLMQNEMVPVIIDTLERIYINGGNRAWLDTTRFDRFRFIEMI